MNAAPPKLSQNRANLWCAAIILGATAAGVAVLVFFFNPATHPFYPVCQFHRLTGLNCPGCGMTRALYALLHGDFLTALRDNALFVLALAAMTVRGAWFGWNKIHGRTNKDFIQAKFLCLLLFLALVFAVLRNLPAFSFLSPA